MDRMRSPETVYTENITRYETELEALKNKIGLFAVIRFLSFAGAAYAIYSGFKQSNDLTVIASIACTILFVVCVRITFRLQDKRRLTEKLIFVNQNELSVLKTALNQFSDGASFHDPKGYTADLDIFGQGSLYGLLNRTTTTHGSETLAVALKSAIGGPEVIEATQKAVAALAPQHGVRQLTTATGLLNEEKEGNLHDVNDWLLEPNLLAGKLWLTIARFVIPAFNIWAFYYFLDTDNTGFLLLGLAVAAAVTGIYSRHIFAQHKLLTKKGAILDQYAGILRSFGTGDAGNSKMLSDLKEDADEAGQGIHQLARLAALFDQRLNLVVFIILNGMLLYDIQCMISLENWKTKYRNKFGKWIGAVGRIELVNSLATFAFNNPAYTYPLADEQPGFSGVEMAHPLIAGVNAVPNTIEVGSHEKLIVLTGSNMSGKTTFLRTIGVNLVLAQCGAPVYASAFRFQPMKILTSIRVGDSLQENTSYFMAELKKLKLIIDELKTGAPALVLIDEILRGTNSDDKTYGSEQYIRQLIMFNSVTLFATVQVGSLWTELLFDYRLRTGIAANKNASFLMQKMGIIKSD
ncbi:MAG: hypothetical protein EOO02_08950 [Chitinophagaceae bacterium]|nr:MAG: hypothetical protein EOO02_08950 [Chitinophagaceae bacterium]